MLINVLLNVIHLCSCLYITQKPYLFLNLSVYSTHIINHSVNLFEKSEIEDCNPSVPIPKPKPPPIYNLEDPLSHFRINKIEEGSYSVPLNLTSLPYVQIEHQDKNKLVPFRDGREILSYYSNKLTSFLSNFREWSQFYDSEPINMDELEIYNPISPNSYYALVFYCAWQSESIALIRAIEQLLGKYFFKRDPPIENKKKPPKLTDIISEYYRREEMREKYEKIVEECKKNNLPIPPEPDYEGIKPVKFNLQISDVEETIKIIDFATKKYNFSWWMPKFGKITYNKLVDKSFNELYNTTYKYVKTNEDRTKYKLDDKKRILRDIKNFNKRTININFVFVRLSNSMMISNSRMGLKRHKRFIQCHEKEFRFNEIFLRMLIEQELYYENMPIIQFFKCVEPVESIPHVYGSKTHKMIPFDKFLNFYRKDPFDICSHVNYGLPPLRKCNHISIMNDFVHLGNFSTLSDIKPVESFDDLFIPYSEVPKLDFLNLLNKTKLMTKDDMYIIEPILYTLTLMYRFQMKKIIDSIPKKPEYIVLNPPVNRF